MTSTGRPVPAATASTTAATSSYSRSIAYCVPACGSPLAPRPRRSMANTSCVAAKRGPTTRNVVWSAVAPWIRSRGEAPARPVRYQAILVPSADVTLSVGGPGSIGDQGSAVARSGPDGIRRQLGRGRLVDEPDRPAASGELSRPPSRIAQRTEDLADRRRL